MKVAIVTGSRAEYGLLYWVIRQVIQDAACELQLFVTGMHLSPEFGLTYKLIETDGFPIAAKIEVLLSSDTPVGISKSVGVGVMGFADTLAAHRPDVIVVLGDRFETFAAVVAALFARIPVAHCHGGETTEGAVDESIRHAITKMAHIHFTATEEYRNRVIQLGENPQNVHTVGALGLENIRRLKLLDKKALEAKINFEFAAETFMVTFHPVTLEHATAERQSAELLDALDQFPNAKVIFTKPNADTDGRVIIGMIDEYVQKSNGRCVAFTSMGQLNYLSALQFIAAAVGNSSSGIIEVPSFGKPSVNIGDRQKGRAHADSVIHCEATSAAIVTAIRTATEKSFRARAGSVVNPYDQGDPAANILNVIKSADLPSLLKKKFFDIKA
jgi:GDP/UDP-N,N'-diacetylbacillosamine 2-epimerase (hydrolysing)